MHRARGDSKFGEGRLGLGPTAFKEKHQAYIRGQRVWRQRGHEMALLGHGMAVAHDPASLWEGQLSWEQRDCLGQVGCSRLSVRSLPPGL